MTRLFLAICAILSATQASALSCLRPDVARTFQWASDAEEQYVVLMGAFSFAAPDMDSGGDINNRASKSVPARFVGSYLGAEGFVDGAAIDVTLNFNCAGPWCGSLSPQNGEILAFVEQTASGYVLDLDPCYNTVFSDPRESAAARVESCMRGEGCDEIPF